MPIVFLTLIMVHLIALHEVGSSNPDGIEIKENKNEKGIPVDGIPMHPYYTIKDLFEYDSITVRRFNIIIHMFLNMCVYIYIHKQYV